MKTSKLLLILIFSLFISLNLFAQGKYEFHGMMMHNGKPVKEGLINIYENDRLSTFSWTLSNGYYKLYLEYDRVYTIEYTKDGLITKRIIINTQIGAQYKDKTLNSNIFAIELNQASEGKKSDNVIPVYNISPGNGNLLNSGKTQVVNKSVNNNSASSESGELIARAKELLAKARLQADSIIRSAERQKKVYEEESKKFVFKTDSLQSLVEQKLFNMKVDEMEGLSEENMKKLRDQNEELKKILSKGVITPKDSMIIIDNRIESTEILMEDLEEQLKQAKLAGDTVLINKLSDQIKDLGPELELMKKERDKFQASMLQKEKELKLQTQRLFMIIGLAALLLVVAFVLYLFFLNKKKSGKILQEKNAMLNQQKEEIQVQAENLLVANEEITAKNDELTLQKEHIKEQHDHIKASVKYASTIQAAILPIKEDMDKYLEYFVIFRPKDVVSGDFYWFAEVLPNQIREDAETAILAAAVDCTGHGVPGAFMSMIGSRVLNEIVNEQEIYDTAQIMTMLDKGINRSLKQDQSKNNDGMDVSMCKIERLKTGQMRVTFTGAKRPLFIYDKDKDEVISIKGDRRSVGGKTKKQVPPFTNNEYILNKGSIIYMTSDGYTDQNNPERKRFGSERFEKFIHAINYKSLEEQKQIMESEMEAYMDGEEQRDDMTVIGIKA